MAQHIPIWPGSESIAYSSVAGNTLDYMTPIPHIAQHLLKLQIGVQND